MITPFSGFSFWSFLIIFAIGYALLRFSRSNRTVINLFMIFVSLVLLTFAFGVHKLNLIFLLLALSTSVYFIGKTINRKEISTARILLNVTAIIFTVLFLCYFKYSEFQSFINDNFVPSSNLFPLTFLKLETPIIFFGVSYFSFKSIHFLVECYNKKFSDLNFLTYLNYILFFPSYFGGPINRYHRFQEDISNSHSHPLSYLEGIKRIITGLFKKIVIAGNLLPYSISTLDLGDESTTLAKAVIGIYSFMFYAYFDFSGYTDMALGSAKLVGINLPENFNYPFFKRNIQQFWANWHMSLTSWLTDYIYWPLVKKTRRINFLKKETGYPFKYLYCFYFCNMRNLAWCWFEFFNLGVVSGCGPCYA